MRSAHAIHAHSKAIPLDRRGTDQETGHDDRALATSGADASASGDSGAEEDVPVSRPSSRSYPIATRPQAREPYTDYFSLVRESADRRELQSDERRVV